MKTRTLTLALIGLILFLMYRHFMLAVTLLLISAIIHYLTHAQEIKLDLGHVFFFAVIFTKIENLVIGILFIVLAGMVPQLITGDIDPLFLIKYPLQILSLILVPVVPLDLIVIGVIFTLVIFVIAFLIAKVLSLPDLEIIDDIALPAVLNIIFFVSFGNLLLAILSQ